MEVGPRHLTLKTGERVATLFACVRRSKNFNRDAYEIAPSFTEGWLARVQSLSTVVAHEGRVELSLFATAKP